MIEFQLWASDFCLKSMWFVLSGSKVEKREAFPCDQYRNRYRLISLTYRYWQYKTLIDTLLLDTHFNSFVSAKLAHDNNWGGHTYIACFCLFRLNWELFNFRAIDDLGHNIICAIAFFQWIQLALGPVAYFRGKSAAGWKGGGGAKQRNHHAHNCAPTYTRAQTLTELGGGDRERERERECIGT